MKYLKYILLICLLLIDGYLIYHASLNANDSVKKSDVVTDIVINTVDKVTNTDDSIEETLGRESISNFVRKLFGHFGLFLLNGILSIIIGCLFIKKKILFYLIIFTHGLLIASITELIQLFSEGRIATFKDIMIDYAGYLLGLGITIIIYIIVKKIKNNTKKELNYE